MWEITERKAAVSLAAGKSGPSSPASNGDTHQAPQSSPLRPSREGGHCHLPRVSGIQGPKVMFPTPLGDEQRETQGFSEYLSPHVTLEPHLCRVRHFGIR